MIHTIVASIIRVFFRFSGERLNGFGSLLSLKLSLTLGKSSVTITPHRTNRLGGFRGQTNRETHCRPLFYTMDKS